MVREDLPEMSELRPEHLNMPAWEVSAVSKKDMFLHEPKAPWPHLGEDGSVKERAPRDITSGVVISLVVGWREGALGPEYLSSYTHLQLYNTSDLCFCSCQTSSQVPLPWRTARGGTTRL